VLPYREDHITVLDLDAGRVTDIRYIADAEALRQMLAAPLPGRAAPAAQVAPGTAPSSAD
jgi:hypothetical protein